jgi:hypothetical protein
VEKKGEKRGFAIILHENAADKGREARPSSLAENGGDVKTPGAQ